MSRFHGNDMHQPQAGHCSSPSLELCMSGECALLVTEACQPLWDSRAQLGAPSRPSTLPCPAHVARR